MSKEKEQLEKITKSIKEMSKQFNDITVCLHHLTKQMHELSEQIKDLKEKQSIIPSVWPIVTPNTGEQDWWNSNNYFNNNGNKKYGRCIIASPIFLYFFNNFLCI